MEIRTTPLALLVASLGKGCGSGPERKPCDPLETMNRAIFKFSDSGESCRHPESRDEH